MPRTLLLVENASVPTDPRVWPECLALRDAGWQVTVVCPAGLDRDTAPQEVVEDVAIHRFRPSESSGGTLGYVGEYAVALRSIGRLVRRLSRTERFDVVHAATPPDTLLLTTIALRRRGTATILDHHDLSPELYEAKFGRRGPTHRALLLAERAGFALADVVISTNESFRRVALERGGKAPEDVFVVRNGPDLTLLHPTEPDASLAGIAPHLLGYVGRMGTQDGVLEALDALESLHARRTDWHAVFVGDGEVLDEARARVAAGVLRSSVTFTGFVSDRGRIARILSACDVCLSPEPHNPLNDRSTLIKVAEYMAVARPVVAFDLVETRFTAGDAALLVAEPGAFPAAIAKLLDDPDLRARMGAAGRARALEMLAWPRSVEPLLSAYERARIKRSPAADAWPRP